MGAHPNSQQYNSNYVNNQVQVSHAGPKKPKFNFGKKKIPLDPNMPKKPLTPYFLFFQ